jgi:hypothetical protein
MRVNQSFALSVFTALFVSLAAGCANISTAVQSPAAAVVPAPPATPAPPVSPPSAAAPPASWQTTVANLPGEDLAGPCNYVLYLANPAAPLRGVLVIYDRADSVNLFDDAGVRSLAGSLALGLLFPEQCNAASFDDIQQNAFAGPGRALFTALDQLAALSSHPELEGSNVLLFGFSAAGVLATTTANYKPSRMIGVIAYDGASKPQQLNSVVPVDAVLQIPFLVLSNDQDIDAGTSRDQIFFARGWKESAPWAYAVQHGVQHCCTLTTKPLILPWISAIVAERLGASNGLIAIKPSQGVFDNYTCSPNGIWDLTGYQDCTFTAASLIPAGGSIVDAQGWLPDEATAAAWLQWVGR